MIHYGQVVPGEPGQGDPVRREGMLRDLLILCELADQGLDRQSAGIDDPWTGPPRPALRVVKGEKP